MKNFIEQTKLLKDPEFNVRPSILLEMSLFPREAYERAGSKKFFHEVKYGNLNTVDRMLQKDPLLVFQYDEL